MKLLELPIFMSLFFTSFYWLNASLFSYYLILLNYVIKIGIMPLFLKQEFSFLPSNNLLLLCWKVARAKIKICAIEY